MSQEILKFNWLCNHTWKRSAKNTAWCLLGCAIGDFGTILFFQLTKIPFPILNIMILAIINGLITSIILETIILIKQNIPFIKVEPQGLSRDIIFVKLYSIANAIFVKNKNKTMKKLNA